MADSIEPATPAAPATPPSTAPETPSEAPTTTDSSVYEAKISELTAALAGKDAEIANHVSALVAAKAANYDLLMSVPQDVENVNQDPATDDSVNIDDLFESKV